MKVIILTVISLLALASAQEARSGPSNFQDLYETRALKFFSAYPAALNFYDLVDGPRVSDAFKMDVNSILEQRADDIKAERPDNQRTEEEEEQEELNLVVYTHCPLHGQFRALSEGDTCTVFEDYYAASCIGIKCPLPLTRSAFCTCSGYVTKSQGEAISKFYKSLENPIVVSTLEAMSKLKIAK